MEWLEVRLVAPDGEAAETVCEVMSRYAHGSPVITEEADCGGRLTVAAYLSDTPEGRQHLRQLREALWHLSCLYPLPEPTVRRLETTDWREAWKRHYRPLRVGRRLLIVPTWETAPEEGRVVVRLDPGMAFGTGQHPSTRTCLCLVEDTLTPGDRVLDVGSGSGILAIAAAKLGAGQVWAVDVDEVAVRATRENAEHNAIPWSADSPPPGGLCVRQGSVEAAEGSFDLIVINILADVILHLLPEVIPRLSAQGRLLLGGILHPQAHAVTRALEEHRLTVQRVVQEGDWMALLAACPVNSAPG
ncbi:MAG: 50S ribosomal protein L11 methyltransferase [Ardenticatenia bacterium]|nr:50S ribosomal protein L11 methyltransferase [Ardenticatenia bacterium]